MAKLEDGWRAGGGRGWLPGDVAGMTPDKREPWINAGRREFGRLVREDVFDTIICSGISCQLLKCCGMPNAQKPLTGRELVRASQDERSRAEAIIKQVQIMTEAYERVLANTRRERREMQVQGNLDR